MSRARAADMGRGNGRPLAGPYVWRGGEASEAPAVAEPDLDAIPLDDVFSRLATEPRERPQDAMGPWTGRVVYRCPSCGTELHANGGGWWCPAEELGFSAAELTGAGL